MKRLESLQNIYHKLVRTKVLQNYSYMTLLQVCSALIGFILYPIVIRRVGMEQYGLYAFLLAIALYFQDLIEFGFHLPAVKDVSMHRDDSHQLSRIVSTVLYAKLLLFALSTVAISVLIYAIPILRTHSILFVLLFLQNLVNVLFPQWYFQGLKQMKIPSIINLCCRLTQIPLTILLVHTQSDIVVYAAIVTGTMLLGSLVAMGCMYVQGIRLQWISGDQLTAYFRSGFPFFLTDVTGSLKERVLTNLIGVVLGMQEVAIYDLAMKIVQIPRLLTQSINRALFPEVITRPEPQRVAAIMRYERWIAFGAMMLIVVLGYPLVCFLGGKQMILSYPIAIILSTGIYGWLVGGAYLQFIFIPHGHDHWVTINQVVALVACMITCGIGIAIHPSIYVFALALAISSLAEIGFCRWMSLRMSN